MTPWILTAGIGIALACTAGWTRGLSRGYRRFLLVILSVALFSLPMGLPASSPFSRFLLAVYMVCLVLKLYDFEVTLSRGLPVSLRAHWVFVLIPIGLVQRHLWESTLPPFQKNCMTLARGILLLFLSAVTMRLAFDLLENSIGFAGEYALKCLGLFLGIYGICEVLAGALRLGGWPARSICMNFFTAATPAEFWQRYNRMYGQAFYENMFRPFGGSHHPRRATFLIFVVSALLHEYVFSIATGRIQGFQTAFFLLQGLAVMITMGWKPRGVHRMAGIVGTLMFNLVSGLLFFASWSQVMPIPWFSEAAPAWLNGGQ